jgi:hypothetical protein
MAIGIELVQVNDMKVGRGGGRKGSGERYLKYKRAVVDVVPWIKQQIAGGETIRVKASDLAKEMGKDFESKHPTSFVWAMKYVLFGEGIWVDTGKTNDNKPVLIMRNATENDVLPDSLAKLGKDVVEEENDEGEVGGESEEDIGGENEEEQ